MKKAILFLLLSASAYSQIIVGEYRIMDETPAKNKPEKIELLKSKKTLFILPPTFSPKEYASVISEVWDITPYEIVWSTSLDEMPEQERIKMYSNHDYSFFKMSSTRVSRTMKSGAVVNYLFNTLDLRVYQFKKTDKKKGDIFDVNSLATIFFSPSIEQRKNVSNVNPRLFLNFDLGYLRTYLKTVNDKLKANEMTSCYWDFHNEEGIKAFGFSMLLCLLRYENPNNNWSFHWLSVYR